MESYLEKLRTEIESLCKDGYLLLCGLTNEMRIPYSEKKLLRYVGFNGFIEGTRSSYFLLRCR